MAARRKPNGSLVPLGFWPMAKMPASVSSLSASATAMPAPVAGKAPPAPRGMVVLVDRGGDFGGLAVGGGVVAPHDALQIGEFAHHGGQQVALGQLGGAHGFRAVGIDELRDLAGERRHAPRLVADGAELCLERNGVEAAQARQQRLLAVLAPEERRIRQTRPHHALIARAHLAGSRLSMLLTVMKCGSSLPPAPSTGKYRW